MPPRALSLTFALAAGGALAQAQLPPVDTPLPRSRPEQRIERIVHEDAGSRIEELRYGGQFESITVQPKGGMPAYQVEPANLSRTRPSDNRNGLSGAGGQRSWNVHSF